MTYTKDQVLSFTEAEYLGAARECIKRGDKVRDDFGDLLNFRGLTDEKIDKLAALLDLTGGTLNRYAKVSREFPTTTWRKVPWGRREILLGISEDAVRSALYNTRPSDEWSLAMLRAAVRTHLRDEAIAKENARRAEKGEPLLTETRKPAPYIDKSGFSLGGLKYLLKLLTAGP